MDSLRFREMLLNNEGIDTSSCILPNEKIFVENKLSTSLVRVLF